MMRKSSSSLALRVSSAGAIHSFLTLINQLFRELAMDPDDHVCLCYRVSLRKIRSYLERENPPVASLISDCLDAGTGCHWCVPFLKHLHAQHQNGQTPDLRISPQRYTQARLDFKKTGRRDIDAENDEG